jgi:hypothetical protein
MLTNNKIKIKIKIKINKSMEDHRG